MLISYLRTIILYLILIAVIRFMGKRQIGQMEASEFVVAILVADLASIPMQDGGIPLLSGLIPILTVLALEWILSALSVKSLRFRKLLCGKPVILIENGNILQENLRRTRVTMDELSGHLREKDVLDIAQVQFAILETNGNLSVFPFPADDQPPQYIPLTVVSDGKLLADNLRKAGKDRVWLDKCLEERNASIQSTWLLTVDGADTVRFFAKEADK